MHETRYSNRNTVLLVWNDAVFEKISDVPPFSTVSTPAGSFSGIELMRYHSNELWRANMSHE
jgi:hypothetical protein